MRNLALKIPPLAVAVVFGAGMVGLAVLLPAAAVPLPGRVPLAAFLALVGSAAAAAGVIAFQRVGTTVNPLNPDASAAVVTSGIYRCTRNPMYLGFLLALCGLGAYLANVASVILLPLFVLYLNRFQIKPEEHAMLRKFGPEYSRYMAAVRRWV
jgi:protein-S-isoprenylcysteine O-methyltransferase Ste14